MPSVCLNMIVKNESHIIETTLINITKHIKFDYWVICDTGSTDNTINIIQSFFKKLNISGEIHQHQWKNFAHNRNLSLELCCNKSDYIFIFDADDEICGNFILPNLIKEGYQVKFGGGFAYNRICIINNSKKWKYFGVLHEVLICQENVAESELIEGNYYFISGRKGSRNNNPNKYLDDALLLETAFKNENEAWLKNRYAFYCGQSYKDAKEFDKAILWYKKVIESDCWIQEKYYACIAIVSLEETRNNLSQCVYYNVLTLNYDTTRWEGLYWLINYYYYNDKKNISDFLVNCIDLSTNVILCRKNKLFLNESIHYYKMYILIMIICYKYKKYDKAIKCLYLLYGNFDYLTVDAINNVINNSQYFIPNDESIQTYVNISLDFVNKCINKFSNKIDYDNSKFVLSKYIYCYTNYVGQNINFIQKYNILNNSQESNIILTITSCKRPLLFKKTINSILVNWCDLSCIQKIVCVDDGTEKKELEQLKILYPWVQFIEKTKQDKGHKSSMNIIHNILINSSAKYWVHIEDDWFFVKKQNYVTNSIIYLKKYDNIGVKQILFNKGYGEIIEDLFWKCGKKLEPNLLLHKHNERTSPCGYWPHYSFRPGITNISVLKELGNYDSQNSFFELDYANKYVSKNYKTAYFDDITCIHIGKLSGKRGNIYEKNSYELNSELQGCVKNIYNINEQFLSNKENLPIKVLNLKRRPDRKSDMEKILHNVDFDFIEAIDGIHLKSDDYRLYAFEGNDFNNNAGTIGCAISHIELWKALMEDSSTDYYIIMEDDIELKHNWYSSLLSIKNDLIQNETVLLGYSMYSSIRKKYNLMYNNNESLSLYDLIDNNYIGGFFCYSINKNGAKKILQHLFDNGIKHGIDYLVMKKIPHLQKKECRPQIAFTEWNEGNKIIDTDIQNFERAIDISNTFYN